MLPLAFNPLLCSTHSHALSGTPVKPVTHTHIHKHSHTHVFSHHPQHNISPRGLQGLHLPFASCPPNPLSVHGLCPLPRSLSLQFLHGLLLCFLKCLLRYSSISLPSSPCVTASPLHSLLSYYWPVCFPWHLSRRVIDLTLQMGCFFMRCLSHPTGMDFAYPLKCH